MFSDYMISSRVRTRKKLFVTLSSCHLVTE